MNNFSLLLLSTAIILLLAYLFYNRILRLVARLTNVVFFIGFAGLIYVVLFPGLHLRLTESLLKDQYLTEQLGNADQSINLYYQNSNKVANTWNRLVGNEEGQASISELRATFIKFIGGCLRTLIVLFSFLLMLLGIYFKYTLLGRVVNI